MNWDIVSAIGSLGALLGVVAVIFQAGKIAQRMENLEERVKNIDRYGCRHATVVHSNKRAEEDEDL